MFHPRSNVSTKSPRLTQQPHGPGHLAISILFLCRPQDACSILWLRWLSTKWTVPVAGVERRQSMLLPFEGLTTTSAHIALAQSKQLATANCKEDWERWLLAGWPLAQIRRLFIEEEDTDAGEMASGLCSNTHKHGHSQLIPLPSPSLGQNV